MRAVAAVGAIVAGASVVGVAAAADPPYVTPVEPASSFQWATNSKVHNHTIQLVSITKDPGQNNTYWWEYEVRQGIPVSNGKINKIALGACRPAIDGAPQEWVKQGQDFDWQNTPPANFPSGGIPNWNGNWPYGYSTILPTQSWPMNTTRLFQIPVNGAWAIDTTHQYTAMRGNGGPQKGVQALVAAPGCNQLVDLGVTKVVTSGATVEPGGTVSYTITVTNNGWWDIPFDAITLDDAGVTLTPDGTPPTTLVQGASFSWTATKVIPSDIALCGTGVTNTASVSVPEAKTPQPPVEDRQFASRRRSSGIEIPMGFIDPVTANDSATAGGVTVSGGACPVPPPPPPEQPVTPQGVVSTPEAPVAFRPPVGVLTLRKTGPRTTLAGGKVTWTLKVTNTGSADVTGVILGDVVPRTMVLGTLPDGATRSGARIRWDIGTLASGQSVTKELPVTLGRTVRGRACNTATVRGTDAGSVISRACTTVTVGRRPATPVTG